MNGELDDPFHGDCLGPFQDRSCKDLAALFRLRHLYSDDGSLNRQFLNLEPRLSLNIST